MDKKQYLNLSVGIVESLIINRDSKDPYDQSVIKGYEDNPNFVEVDSNFELTDESLSTKRAEANSSQAQSASQTEQVSEDNDTRQEAHTQNVSEDSPTVVEDDDDDDDEVDDGLEDSE